MDLKLTSDMDDAFRETLPRSTRRLIGKRIRDQAPRSDHATWKPAGNRPNVCELLIESNKDRLPHLVPIRHGRMRASPLAFFRGLALAMSYDLTNTPNSGIQLPICGDCHLQNLGWFATPERNLVFDIIDFDETASGFWEWDLKRLVVSFVLAARELGLGHSHQQELVHQVARAYRERIAIFEQYDPLQMWYQRIDAAEVLAQAKLPVSRTRTERLIVAAKSRTIEALLPKITQADESRPDRRRFVEQPPLLTRDIAGESFLAETELLLRSYQASLSNDRAELFQRYRLSDMALKVVGVGSVGLRCGVLLFEDSDNAPLVLQIKEARPSILVANRAVEKTCHEGYRVIHGQRLVQAASDMFLGWTTDSKGTHYYLRQLRDMKLTIDLLHSDVESLLDYGQLCGWALARAHAKSGKASYIAGYLGAGEQMDTALRSFGVAYADQVEADFQKFLNFIRIGVIATSL